MGNSKSSPRKFRTVPPASEIADYKVDLIQKWTDLFIEHHDLHMDYVAGEIEDAKKRGVQGVSVPFYGKRKEKCRLSLYNVRDDGIMYILFPTGFGGSRWEKTNHIGTYDSVTNVTIPYLEKLGYHAFITEYKNGDRLDISWGPIDSLSDKTSENAPDKQKLAD